MMPTLAHGQAGDNLLRKQYYPRTENARQACRAWIRPRSTCRNTPRSASAFHPAAAAATGTGTKKSPAAKRPDRTDF